MPLHAQTSVPINFTCDVKRQSSTSFLNERKQFYGLQFPLKYQFARSGVNLYSAFTPMLAVSPLRNVSRSFSNLEVGIIDSYISVRLD